MKSLSMKIEDIDLDVYYDAEVCKNSNGVGGPTTCEVALHSVDFLGENIKPLLSDDILARIEQHIINDEMESLK